VNWELADIELAAEIEDVAKQIKVMVPPVQVSAAAIIREIGNKHWIECALRVSKPFTKLPRTTSILSQLLESLLSYQLRKLEWAAETFREQEICPTRYQLTCKAKIRNKSGKTLRIQKELTSALDRLSNMRSGVF
jgi:hypothetical protein